MVVRAQGEIGSGVLGSGLTPPTGWEEMIATSQDVDWPYRGNEDSFRYSLIGTFVGHDIPTRWFYIGRGRTIVGDGGAVFGAMQLRLAVNRPHVDREAVGPNRGDHQWDVEVDVHQFEGGERHPTGEQDRWKWCANCQGLAFTGSGSVGRCPVGGEHDHSRSGNYRLIQDGPGQGDWRWCHKCQGLFFHGNSSFGRCPVGGVHAPDALAHSSNYTIGSPGQQSSGARDGWTEQNAWRWCRKCQGLYFRRHGLGRCPEGDTHAEVDTGDYALLVRP